MGATLQINECLPLIESSTPTVCLRNAFRLTGLPVDASNRDIRRRIDDLKAATEMGDVDVEHTHAFALSPAPGLDLIRDAARRLQDPELRIIEEFFWFWPIEWGAGYSDAGLSHIKKGDWRSAMNFWQATKTQISSKHNLAIFYLLIALDAEHVLLSLEDNKNLRVVLNELTGFSTLDAKSPEAIERHSDIWRESFGYWEQVMEDEDFWDFIANRIRQLDDARVTSGFARRLRASLPEAMDKINAMLAVKHAEKNMFALVKAHIGFMKETSPGKDDVSKTLSIVTKPFKERIQTLADSSITKSRQDPDSGGRLANDLIDATQLPLHVMSCVYQPDAHELVDLRDLVASACLKCQVVYVKKTGDWTGSVEILEKAEKIAASKETKEFLCEQKNICIQYREDDKPSIREISNKLDEISALKKIQQVHELFNVVAPMLAKAMQVEGAASETYQKCADMVALRLRSMAIDFYNSLSSYVTSKDSKGAYLFLIMELQNCAKKIAVSADVKNKLAEDEKTVSSIRGIAGKEGSRIGMKEYFQTWGIKLVWGGGEDPDVWSDRTTVFFKWVFNGGWILLLIGLGILASLFSSGSSQSSSSSSGYKSASSGYTSTYHAPVSSELSETKAKVDALSLSIKEKEGRISSIREEIRASTRKMNLLKLDIDAVATQYTDASYVPADVEATYKANLDTYNDVLLPEHNRLVREESELYSQYEQELSEHNALADSYNQKIR